jgi:hypothetical protein
VTDRSSGADLSSLLAALEGRLRRFGAPVVEAFRPGAPAGRVRGELAAEDLAAPDDLVVWWGWHDGVEGPAAPDGPGIVERAESVLVDGWHLLSLADALRIRRWTLADYAQAGGAALVPRSWVPVLHFTGTAYLAADAGAGKDKAPLYLVDGGAGLPEPSPTPQFGSLAELVSLLVRLLDEGIVRPDPGDPRVPSLSGAPVTEEVRRLTRW